MEQPHPGYFITRYTPQPLITPDGLVIAPGILIIPPEIPADLLRAIAAEKDTATLSTPTLSAPLSDAPSDPLSATLSDTLSVSSSTGSTVTTTISVADSTHSLPARLVHLLRAAPTQRLRLKDLSTALGVPAAQIRAADGQGFTIGHSGWVALALAPDTAATATATFTTTTTTSPDTPTTTRTSA